MSEAGASSGSVRTRGLTPSSICPYPISYEEYVPLAKRRQLETQKYRELVGRAGYVDDSLSDGEDAKREVADGDNRPKESLLLAAVRMRKDQPEATEADKQLEEEADILKHVLQKQALRAVKELAQVRPAYRHIVTSMWPCESRPCTGNHAGQGARGLCMTSSYRTRHDPQSQCPRQAAAIALEVLRKGCSLLGALDLSISQSLDIPTVVPFPCRTSRTLNPLRQGGSPRSSTG